MSTPSKPNAHNSFINKGFLATTKPEQRVQLYPDTHEAPSGTPVCEGE